MNFQEFKKTAKHKLSSQYSDKEVKVIISAIIEQFCGVTGTSILLNDMNQIHTLHLKKLFNALKRLSEHEPLEYVLGCATFLDLKLWLNNSVFIPRPETEELVMHIIDYFHKTKTTPENILDIATGSGCIALALKKKYPRAVVTATDKSQKALLIAKYNANLNKLVLNIHLHDILKNESPPINIPQDVIVCNPPYVLPSEKKLMRKNVIYFEPYEAIFIDFETLMLFYNKLKHIVTEYLNSGGCFIFEINENLHREIFEIFSHSNSSFSHCSVLKDFFGKPRFIFGNK